MTFVLNIVFFFVIHNAEYNRLKKIDQTQKKREQLYAHSSKVFGQTYSK